MCATNTVSVLCICLAVSRKIELNDFIRLSHTHTRSWQKEISVVKIRFLQQWICNKNEDIKLNFPRNCYHHWMCFSVWIWIKWQKIPSIRYCCAFIKMWLWKWIELILIEILIDFSFQIDFFVHKNDNHDHSSQIVWKKFGRIWWSRCRRIVGTIIGRGN